MKKWLIVLIVVIVLLGIGIFLFIKLNNLPPSYVEECEHKLYEEIESSTQKMINYNKCVVNLAVERNSVSLCKKSGEPPYGCYIALAASTGDESLCKKIKPGGGSDIWCYGAAKKDESYCDTYEEGSYKDICLWGVAEATSDVELCKEIRNPSVCLNKIALKEKNPDICEEWRDVEEEDDSQGEVDRCLYNIAMEIRDSNICYNINWTSRKDDCLYNLAKLTKNSVLCNNMSESGSYTDKNSCYWHLARINGDESLCEKIILSEYIQEQIEQEEPVGTNSHDGCMENVALIKEDKSLCDEIYNQESLKGCKEDVQKVIDKDESVCYNLMWNVAKDFCEDSDYPPQVQ
tara:strand:+ start:1057 stop:2097 length:1041 start_codon:yes stop_codon:yes gene_type:complete